MPFRTGSTSGPIEMVALGLTDPIEHDLIQGLVKQDRFDIYLSIFFRAIQTPDDAQSVGFWFGSLCTIFPDPLL